MRVNLSDSEWKLMNRLWESDAFVDENTLTVNVARLRKKLEPDPRNPVYIKTVIRAGYKIEIPEKPWQQGDDCTQ